MPILQTSSPKGLLPIQDKFKLPEEVTTICENVEIRSGSMVSHSAPSDILDNRTIVEQISLTPNYTIIKGPINDDQFSRHYYSTHEKSDKVQVLVSKPINFATYVDASNPFITNGASDNLYDENDSTFILFNEGYVVSYDFNLAMSINSVMVSFTSAQFVNTIVSVEYSDNNSTWTEAKRITLISTSKDQIRDLPDSGPHRYWRLKAISGDGRLNRFAMYNGTLHTTEARDVFIASPDEPTIDSLPIDNSTVQASLIIGSDTATLNKLEIEGNYIKGHFTVSSDASGTAAAGIYGTNFSNIDIGQVYPKSKLYLEKDAVRVGTINLVSVSKEVLGGLDYTDTDTNYVALFEYQLFTSSTQERSTQYVVAYEDDLGQVGEPSVPVEFNAIERGSIRIAKLTFSDVKDDNAIYTRIYRSGPDGQYYLAGKVSIGVLEFEDIYNEGEYERLVQGEPLGNFGNPPEGLTNLCLVAGGVMAGTDHKKTVWLSDPNKPNVMTYSRTTVENIVGMASTGSELIVCTEGNPELITGSHPAVMSQDIIMTNQACLSRDSITQVKNAILYAGTDGLVSVVGARGDIITSKVLSAKQWMEYDPASMIGVSLDGKYYGFNSTGNTFVFDLGTGELSNISVSANAAYSDISEDAIYIDQGDGARKLFGHISTKLNKTVQSRFYRFPNPLQFTAIRVNAESYVDTQVEVYVNGVLATTITPINANSRRLPRIPQAREIYYKVTGSDTVVSVEIATSMGELRG